jgi:hypothetical protein
MCSPAASSRGVILFAGEATREAHLQVENRRWAMTALRKDVALA